MSQNIADKDIGEAAEMGLSESGVGGGQKGGSRNLPRRQTNGRCGRGACLREKKVSKNGVYCELSLIGRPIETLT